MAKKFQLEIVGAHPFQFPPPGVVEIDEFYAKAGTVLILKSFEHRGDGKTLATSGLFSPGVEIERIAIVVNVKGRFNVSFERGFEDLGNLPVLVVAFPN